jgi:anti-sigma B factor antagonist
LTSTIPAGRPTRLHSGVEIHTDDLVIGIMSVDRTALLRLDGELDAASGPVLIDVGRTLAEQGSEHLVIDCGHLRFCDSGGLAAFISIRQAPSVRSVALVRTTATVRRILEVTGLDVAFDLSTPSPSRWRPPPARR